MSVMRSVSHKTPIAYQNYDKIVVGKRIRRRILIPRQGDGVGDEICFR